MVIGAPLIIDGFTLVASVVVIERVDEPVQIG